MGSVDLDGDWFGCGVLLAASLLIPTASDHSAEGHSEKTGAGEREGNVGSVGHTRLQSSRQSLDPVA